MAVSTTSGTYSYSQTVTDIATKALRLAQIVGTESTPTASETQEAVDAMAAMVKGWMASGIHVWCEEECVLFLQTSQVLYSLGAGSADHACLYQQLNQSTIPGGALSGATSVVVASATGMLAGDNFGVQLSSGVNFWTTISGAPSGNTVTLASSLPAAAAAGAICFDYTTPLARPLRVMGGRRYTYASKLDVPMLQWARLEYQGQPNKFTPGTPTAFFFDPQTGQGAYSAPAAQFNVWPSPPDYTNGVRFTAQRPIQDVGNLASIPDFPVEWNAALKWGLAAEVGPEYGCPLDQMQLIEKRAAYWFDMASRWDREPESLRFGVAMRPGYRRG